MTTKLKRLALTLATLATTGLALSDAQAQAADPVKGGTLIYLEQQAHTNLYPPAGGFYPNGGILNQITDKLTYQNPKTLEIEPWIAESWTVNANATEYTFKIRPGVTFSDGSPLDAAAVAKNYDVFGLGNKALKQPVSEVINNYERSEVVDPLTVKFYFKKPSPGFLQGTSVIGSGLVAASTLALPFEELGDATKIIGSGPFVVESETIGKELNLTARDEYNWGPAKLEHQGRAYLDGIKYIITGEDSVRIGALLAGQADFIRQVQAYDEGQVEAQDYQIYAPSTRGVNNSVVFRPDNPLVSDIRVRQALLHATDTKEIVTTLFSANYPQATSIIASSALGYKDISAKLAFDPAKAKALLDEAGWSVAANGLRQKDGKELVLTAYESLPQPQNKETLQLVAQQWGKVGVKLSVLAGDSGSKTVDDLDPLKTPVSPAMVGRADPDVIKSQYYPKNRDVLRQKGGLSDKVQSFVDTKLNGLLDALASEPDRQKRLAIAGEVQDYVVDQAYAIPIFEEPQAYAGAPYVQGVAFEAVGRPSFYSTWLAEH
ncbi:MULTISPECIES: TIGR04028 family ABC transporter substrate-binding protein [Ensifer]|jgi:peptide/nickel transport system substrate-binding protein|uniref:TIGR04028 family ABC transporter substrate-binding protein n=1 Tax=Ensifer adhaerens TaxID=106592 RepID=A0ABY8HL79_ENSAD|nr:MULTISPECIES: TIGR04028 family ABC transporter substrate-binding protein [Ensifer]ANK75730.1 ABC transporter substrate binding protein [Ensifer adhaerens]KDP73532.1 ABC transporter substrate-binding protein [Ensifer adhaerens]MBD9541525.1 TIGR04028 family ABC transporter substrate-binding protein [Ensifer sp. ENS04]QHG73167.1 TIGR04028 family ABC transporter substrate-binding protein [Ensifer adhaerens]WFP92881.1 TIGR04028 family ABC transporter substrate-binding protein [Ensifer adhaerens]